MMDIKINNQVINKQINQPSDAKDKQQASDGNAMLYAFYQILESQKILTQTAGIQAKEIQANAKDQQKLIDELSQLHYQMISPDEEAKINGATKETEISKGQFLVQSLMIYNQGIDAQSSYYTAEVTLDKQNAQLWETDLNTNANNVQNATQVCGQICQVTQNLTNQITQM